ncbi:MAG: class I SAM-dependent methyltransferase [Pirellulaceae bacterium]
MNVVKNTLSILVRPKFSWIDLLLVIVILAGALFAVFIHGYATIQRGLFAAAFQNTFPEVRLADQQRTTDSEAYRKAYDFTTDWFTNNIPVWQQALAELQGQPNIRYLEIGVYEGRSAVWMLENILTHPTATVTAIDLFDGPYRERYFANIRRTGAADKVTSIANFSQIALRELPLDSYDIIYIDGSHAKEDVLEDAVLSWRLLKEGGMLIFDDYQWAGSFAVGTSDKPSDFPKTAIDAFVQCFGDHLEVTHNAYQIILRKKTCQPE